SRWIRRRSAPRGGPARRGIPPPAPPPAAPRDPARPSRPWPRRPAGRASGIARRDGSSSCACLLRYAMEGAGVPRRRDAPARLVAGRTEGSAPRQGAGLLQLDLEGLGQFAARHVELLLAHQVLDRDHATGLLVRAGQHHEADAGARGVLELLADLA